MWEGVWRGGARGGKVRASVTRSRGFPVRRHLCIQTHTNHRPLRHCAQGTHLTGAPKDGALVNGLRGVAQVEPLPHYLNGELRRTTSCLRQVDLPWTQQERAHATAYSLVFVCGRVHSTSECARKLPTASLRQRTEVSMASTERRPLRDRSASELTVRPRGTSATTKREHT